jgi:hypothetical protein
MEPCALDKASPAALTCSLGCSVHLSDSPGQPGERLAALKP